MTVSTYKKLLRSVCITRSSWASLVRLRSLHPMELSTSYQFTAEQQVTSLCVV